MLKKLGAFLLIARVAVCGFLALVHFLCIPVVLVADGMTGLQRVVALLICLLFSTVFYSLCWRGSCLKYGKKEGKAQTKPRIVAKPTAPECEYLNDITFIKAISHTSAGEWQQYDVVLDARGYGWETMKEWADYMATADLEHISRVEAGILGGKKQDVTQSYADHGGKCKQTPELNTEQGMLSMAGFSRALKAPVKIVWMNQTQKLRFFTTTADELLIRKYVETVIRRTFETENAMKPGKPKPAPQPQTAPVRFEGTSICVDSAALLQWLPAQYELQGVLPLTEKEPTITLYEDGVKTREYRLQTEKDEDFTGKFFQISVRIGIQGSPPVPAAQIDGFVSDTPEDRQMTLDDVGYRMEGHFLACGGETAKLRYEMIRGQDLPMKALKYPGYTTPSNVRLVGICPDCGKSFCFHGYACYMAQNDVAYSDDGLDCCQISDFNIDKDSWTYEADGKTFRYYNSFCCPHCGTPYIDYRKFPEKKAFGVSGCVHLGRKLYDDYSNS